MKFSKFLAATAASIFITGAASAATLTPDTLLGSASLGNSSDAAEIAELESLAGLAAGSLTVNTKMESGSFGKDDVGNWFVDVAPDEPGFFVLKFGIGNLAVDDTYFFKNIAELTKLVWTDGNVNGLLDSCDVANGGTTTIGDPCRLSHVTYTDPSPVPLPAAGWMLIAGVGGLAAMRRRKKS